MQHAPCHGPLEEPSRQSRSIHWHFSCVHSILSRALMVIESRGGVCCSADQMLDKQKKVEKLCRNSSHVQIPKVPMVPYIYLSRFCTTWTKVQMRSASSTFLWEMKVRHDTFYEAFHPKLKWEFMSKNGCKSATFFPRAFQFTKCIVSLFQKLISFLQTFGFLITQVTKLFSIPHLSFL